MGIRTKEPCRFGWLLTIFALYLCLAAVYAYLGAWRYTIFRAGVDDFIFTQVIDGAFTTFSSTIEGSVNHFLIHFSPILYFAFPFVRTFNGARGLVFLQCLLAAATIFPVWGMAASRLPKWLALATTLVAASYPPLSAEAVGDFHELAFVPPIAATLVWAIDRRSRSIAIASTVLLAMIKEDQFVSLAFIGLVVVITARDDRKMRSCGFWIISIAVTAAVLYFGLLRPLIDPHFGYFSLHFYQWWRSPPTPAGFAGLLSPLRPQYLFTLLLPLAFLPLASRYMVFAIPALAEVLLSHEAITMAMGAHYTATWIGYVLCAFADGTAGIYRRSELATKSLLGLALLASIWTSRYFSPINPGFALYRKPATADLVRENELAKLPRNASIATGGFIIAHLGMHPHANIAMDDPQDYLVFDAFSSPAFWSANDAPKVAQLVKSGAYRKVYEGAGIVVLIRR